MCAAGRRSPVHQAIERKTRTRCNICGVEVVSERDQVVYAIGYVLTMADVTPGG
jgi:hypothetical protein